MLKSRGPAINATAFEKSCPQFQSNKTTICSVDSPKFTILKPNKNSVGEDCLSVNIWTPKGGSRGSGEALPVVVRLYGGGFQTGGGNVPYQNPSNWVERSQKHIVVSINYRLNIFGFPNAAGLPEGKSNIANFGGDVTRIILWRQSAGAVSVDLYNFAYAHDPIINGLILNSGSALLPFAGYDPPHSNFACGNLSTSAELDYLRQIPSADITAFLEERDNSGAARPLTFTPIVNGITRFDDYTARALARNFTKKSAVIGTTSNEGVAFVPYDRENGPANRSDADRWTGLFACPAVKTTQNRYAVGAPTFRYLYAGNFSNISPRWWEGAYHSSELPLVFGTSGIARGASTSFEREVEGRMQNFWVAFVEDPVGGLTGIGWEAYESGGDAVLFGWCGTAVHGGCRGELGRGL